METDSSEGEEDKPEDVEDIKPRTQLTPSPKNKMKFTMGIKTPAKNV